ncbi:hypothetical protein I5L67_30830, partial [Pseudomonas aeruginosa]|nr:hypothetical protein [Pseudomonas aeruginosa]
PATGRSRHLAPGVAGGGAAGPAEPYAVAQQPRAAAGRAGLAGAARRRPCRDLGPAAQGRAARQGGAPRL